MTPLTQTITITDDSMWHAFAGALLDRVQELASEGADYAAASSLLLKVMGFAFDDMPVEVTAEGAEVTEAQRALDRIESPK
jgi:hypothetical protein